MRRTNRTPAAQPETAHSGDREARARNWLESTEITPAVARLLTVCLLMTVLGALVIDAANLWRTRHTPLSVSMDAPQPSASARWIQRLIATVPSSERIKAFERKLEDRSVFAGWIRPRAQYALTRLVGAGNEQVYPGRQGWLYYRDDIDHLTGPPIFKSARSASTSPVDAIRQLHEDLKARGVHLVVMPTALKPMIYPDLLTARVSANRPITNPDYTRLLNRLREQGVDVFDTVPKLASWKPSASTPLYLRADTHWTASAMERMAEGLARHIEPRLSSASAPVRYSRQSRTVTHVGDVAVMLGLMPNANAAHRQQQLIHPVAVNGQPWTPTRGAGVLLLGDSFSNIYSQSGLGWGSHAGLAEQLSYALRRPVDRITINAGGENTTRDTLRRQLTRDPRRLDDVQVVVYQFACRDLSSTGWRPIRMPAAQRIHETVPPQPSPLPSGPGVSQPMQPSPAPGEPLATGSSAPAEVTAARVVEGTVAARTSPPDPSAVPYADCLIAVHLTGVSAVQGAKPTDELVVFVWGMRDRKPTSASRWRTGERIRLKLTPWDQVESQYGSYNRIELEDEHTLMLDVYWGESTP